MEGKPGCVYLVGAGCGEADLITLRGLSLLRRCGVVVYDDLIAAELLEEVPREAEAIYAGKRSGRRAMAQEDISALLVRKAQEGRVVVRLKGGDPFVFGRGGEEALALQAAGVLWEAVPGVSSAIAIPGQAGIPVTHRGVSQGVHIVTAHTAGTPDGLPEEFDRLASLPGTLVLLMGLARLDTIVRRLLQAGMSPQTPAAVLSGGNAPRPMAVRGTLADISSRCREVLPPAVIVVGEAAALELDRGRPLHGVTVGLTGTERTADRLRPGLRLLGAEVFRAQRSRVEELETPIPWNLLGDHQNRWLVFTSGNGVERFFRRAQRERVDLRRLSRCRLAAVGPATGEALEAHGFFPDLVPAGHTTRDLARALSEALSPQEEVWLLRSALGSPALAEALGRCAPLREFPLYTLRPDPESARRAQGRRMDYLVFSSASGVEFFFQAWRDLPAGTVPVCIGPVTAAALKTRCARPFLTAPDISAQGLLRAILGDRPPPPM